VIPTVVPTVTVTTRKGHKVTLYRLADGLYLSPCRRFLLERRDRHGAEETVNHRNGKYAIRRKAKGWQVADLESGWWGSGDDGEDVLHHPNPWYQGDYYSETLRDAAEHLDFYRDRFDERLAAGAYVAVAADETLAAYGFVAGFKPVPPVTGPRHRRSPMAERVAA
jgi:hypothetical protein